MTTPFRNVYDDEERARAYADLEFPGTYYLAFRDVPQLLARHITGTRALDFGCGAGRSTRFLRDQGFDVIGVDISEAMLGEAAARDPRGTYLCLTGDEFGALGSRTFDLVFAAFTFDNVPVRARRIRLFRELATRLAPRGRFVIVVSSAEIYVNEWLSFSTRDFPENRNATSGELVRIVMLDVPDRRPVEDFLWTDADYLTTFASAGLEVIDVHRPMGSAADPFRWVSECDVAPWTIYVSGNPAQGGQGAAVARESASHSASPDMRERRNQGAPEGRRTGMAMVQRSREAHGNSARTHDTRTQ